MSKWIKDGRANESVGGGFFVFRRGDWSGRIRPSKSFPFEHATLEAATAEAARLAASRPGSRFDVMGILSSLAVPAPAVDEQQAVSEPA